MIPIKLSLSGFLSYRDPVEIDFTQFGLACISGPNGAGKSSLLDAITWVLFGQARKRDDSVINMQSETAEVDLTFEYENNIYRVRRAKPADKTTLLEFHIQTAAGKWKAITERTLRGTEVLIEETLHLDYETFVNASFFLQGKADQFTQQRPADRKRILSNILGLEVWETYRKAAADRRKGIENQISELDGRLQEVNAELGESDQRIARQKEVQARLDTISQALSAQTKLLEELRKKEALLKERQQMVDTLAAQAERTRSELEQIQERLGIRQQEVSELEKLIASAEQINADYQRWQQARADLAQWEETATRFNEQEKRRHAPLTEIETERTRLETELNSLRRDEEELATSLKIHQDLLAQQKVIHAEVEGLALALAERDRLAAERQQTLQRQAEAKAENPLLKAEMDELMGRIKQLESTAGATCPLCGQPLSPDDRERLIAELKTEGTQKGDKYRVNQALLKSVGEEIDKLDQQLRTYETSEPDLREKTRLLDQTASQIETIQANQAKWEQSGAPRLVETKKALKEENYAQKARQTLAEIDAELKEIGYDTASHDAVRKLEVELRQAEAEHLRLENSKAALTPLEREIKELSGQIKTHQHTLREQEDAHLKAAAQLAADQTEVPDTLAAERGMLDLQEQANQVRLELGHAQQNVQVLETLKQRKVSLEAERELLAKEVIEHKVLERAFSKNGVPAMLIEQALPQIEAKANEILERLSGGSMSIRFITQQAYKDSKRDDLRETLDIQISDSAGIRDYEMYSGGEAFRINFAIRLALSEVLAQRAGARLQTLVIDEGFGSQDEIGRQRLIEAINLVKADFAKILVITHIDELKDAFPNRLEVTKTQRGSVVDVV